uniref:C1q domain-containing protein n=1 Tax=Oryzias latipes TaxID=8090 RepID=A0A3P9L9U4_ORYLA
MTSPALFLTFISGLTVAHYAAAGPYEPCPFDPCIVLKEINALKEALEARDVPKVAFSARTSKGGAYGNFQGDTTLTYNAVITNVGDAYNPPTDVPKVAFSARTSKGGPYGNIQDDRTLTYNAVITNVGYAYNPATGIFTAPVKGLYYFTFFAHGGGMDRIQLQLKKDGTVVAEIHDHPSNADTADNAGNAVFLELEQGNQVYVNLVAKTAVWGEGFVTTFSGVLLSKS